MKIIITVKEAIELSIWEDVARVSGYSVYAPKEGFDSDFEIQLTEEEAKEVGIKMFVAK